MVWVYNSPFTPSEQKIADVLKVPLKNKRHLTNTVKLLSLYGFLKKQNFKNSQEVETSAYYDDAHTKPVFNEKQAKIVFRELKQKGGQEEQSDYPFTAAAVEKGVDTATLLVPEEVKNVAATIGYYLTYPVKFVESNVPLGPLLLEGTQTVIQVGNTALANIGEALGGPIGAILVIPITATAASFAAIISLGKEDSDIGQATVNLIIAIPFIGPIVATGIDKVEKFGRKYEKYKSKVDEVRQQLSGMSVTDLFEKAKEANPELTARAQEQAEKARQRLQEVAAPHLERVQQQLTPERLEQFQRAKEIGQQAKSFVTNPENQQRARELGSRVYSAATNPTTIDRAKRFAMNQMLPKEKTAGKRFSTRRTIHNKKWNKTKRNKSAKV